MSHGTKPGFRAPQSKLGRNTRKCERYTAERRKDRNKTHRDGSREYRWHRDNHQRIARLNRELNDMVVSGVSTQSIAYRDVHVQYMDARAKRDKWGAWQ